MKVCVCVCVCVRERERERERAISTELTNLDYLNKWSFNKKKTKNNNRIPSLILGNRSQITVALELVWDKI